MQEEWDNSYDAYLNDKLSTVFSVDEYSDDLEERRQLINNIYIEFYSNFGLSVAKNENDEYFFIGEHDIISGKKYEFAMISPGGVAVVKIDGKWLVVNALEEIISEKKYDGVLNFKGKTLFVKLDNKYNLIDNNGKELSNFWFDEVYKYDEDYSIVEVNNKFNYVDFDGNLFFDTWFDSKEKLLNYKPSKKTYEVDDILLEGELWQKGSKSNHFNYVDGVAPIKSFATISRLGTVSASNYVDKTNRPISPIWFDEIYAFRDGFAKVKKYNKYSILRKNGELLVNGWFDSVGTFNGLYARLDKEYVDKDGNLFNVWKFPNGLTRLRGEKKQLFITTNGTPLYGKEYKQISNFSDGLARVEIEKDCYNYVDINGREVSDKYFTYASDFIYGRAVVQSDNKYYFIDRKINVISEKYDYVSPFCDFQRPIVKVNNKKMLLDSNFREVLSEWYDDVEYAKEGYIIVEKNKKKTIFDMEGNQITDKWYDYVACFKHGCAVVGILQEHKMMYNVIDKKGNEWGNWVTKEPNILHADGSFSRLYYDKGTNEVEHYQYYDMGDYKVKKGLIGYKCIGPKRTITLKYEPVRLYGENIIICKDNGRQLYEYHIDDNSYEKLYHTFSMTFDDYFMIITSRRDEKEVYFMYGDKKIDISKYYVKYLDHRKIKLNPNIELLSKDEFFALNEDDIREKYRETQREKEELARQKRESEREYEVKRAQKKNEDDQRKLENKKREAIKAVAKASLVLKEYENKTGKISRIDIDDILIDHGGYKEIHPVYIGFGLKYLNLANMPIKDVKVSGIDFRDTNISFGANDPQYVYNKDMSNSNFEGIIFSPAANFDGVNICGSRFSRNNTGKIIDISEENFKNAIYDENTTLDGIKLIDLIKKDEEKKQKM